MTTGAATSLSLRARIGQVNQRLKGWEAVRWIDGSPRVTDVLRREVDRWGGIGAVYGVLRADPWSEVDWSNGIPPERSAEAYAAVQDCVISRGDGLPTLFVEEAPHGLMALGATTLPVNLALGAGMDDELTEELAAVVASEARGRGTHVVLVSGLDMLRDPRWGRAEESFSEDPALAALLVASTVRGMQGSAPGAPIDDQHVAVVAKHVAAQGAGIGGRNGSGAPIGPRELGEIHLRPVHAAAAAGVAGFMAAYNDIDGVPCCGHPGLLTGTLRGQWGWDGVVMADGTAVDRLRDSVTGSAEAAALALRAGVDLSLWDESFTHVEEAIDRGMLDVAVLDRAVERVLALKRRVGVLGDVTHAEPVARDVVELSRRAARAAVVVLEDRLLPVSPRTVAVIGPNADDLHAQLGDYTPPPGNATGSTVRQAWERRLGADRVRYVQGCTVRDAAAEPGAMAAVTEACLQSDLAVVVLGGTSRRHYGAEFAGNGALAGTIPTATNGEGVDLATLELPGGQRQIARAAAASGTPVVVVIIDGRPRPLGELTGLADAVILAPFPGPAGGEAIVATLLEGHAGGRLPATLPAVDGAVPVSHDERVETARGYLGAPDPRGHLFGTTAHDIGAHVVGGDRTIDVTELADGAAVAVRVRVSGRATAAESVTIPVYGRRHEDGVRPRRRTLLSVVRVTMGAEGGEALLSLGLPELGSWATGEPVAVPARITIWATPDLDPPDDAPTLHVKDS